MVLSDLRAGMTDKPGDILEHVRYRVKIFCMPLPWLKRDEKRCFGPTCEEEFDIDREE